ncbi:MAG TPA: DUF3524 domain-containing protein, partial [Roseiflexaceae bacterium]
MRILYLNPFHGGSHAAVAEGYARRSRHDITLLTLSIAGGWRWRMRGAAVTLARMLRENVRQADKETRRQGAHTIDLPISRFPDLPVSRSRGLPVWLRPDPGDRHAGPGDIPGADTRPDRRRA